MAANHILYIRNLRPMTSTRFESTKRVDLIGQFVSKAQQIYRGCSSTLKDFESKGWNLEKRLKKSFKKQCEINREIACSHVYYKALFRAVICQKLLLEEVYTLDR